MRCFSCNNFSIEPICKSCQKTLLIPEMIEDEVGNLEVISFFDYYATVEFIKSKYSASGYRIYKFLAKKFFAPFIKSYINYLDKKNIYLIGVDENIERGYSNVAILTHFGAKENKVKVLHNALKAKNRVKYAGKSLEYRLDNPRDFVYKGPKDIEAILIDDTTTTGLTLEQAQQRAKRKWRKSAFCFNFGKCKRGDGLLDFFNPLVL